jgi:hypothetical protein
MVSRRRAGRRFYGLLGLSLIAAVLTAACAAGGSGDRGKQDASATPELSRTREAPPAVEETPPTVERVGADAEAAVRAAAAAAGVTAHLVDDEPADLRVSSCLSWDAPKDGSVQVNRSYFVRGLPRGTQDAAVAAMRGYWLDHGWAISSERRVPPDTSIVASQAARHLGMTLDAGVGGIGINVQSACFRAADSTPADATPGG